MHNIKDCSNLRVMLQSIIATYEDDEFRSKGVSTIMRSRPMFELLISLVVKTVIGCERFKTEVTSGKKYIDFVTVYDEAFSLLILENCAERILDMIANPDDEENWSLYKYSMQSTLPEKKRSEGNSSEDSDVSGSGSGSSGNADEIATEDKTSAPSQDKNEDDVIDEDEKETKRGVGPAKKIKTRIKIRPRTRKTTRNRKVLLKREILSRALKKKFL